MNIPVLLTFVRILSIPFLFVSFYLPFEHAHILTTFIFVVASITDWLDGYLARSLSQVTPFGDFLDPVADKLLVAASLILIIGENPYPQHGQVLVIPSLIIICREITISSLREWMAQLGLRMRISVVFIGKIKTAMQMLALSLLLFYHPSYSRYYLYLGTLFLYVSSFLTLWSMLIYLKIAWPSLTHAK